MNMDDTLFMPSLSVGDTVPSSVSFKVFHAGDVRDVTVGDYRGKWLVLFFYPGDFTFICPTELGDLAVNYESFREEGAEVVSMSTDTVFSHKMWHETSPTIRQVQFPMGSDHRQELVDLFNVFCEEDGLAYRASLLIDPEGVIRSVEVHDNSIGRSVKELLRKVRAAKYVKEHPGQVCPVNWEKGEDTLTPGTDLVGKI